MRDVERDRVRRGRHHSRRHDRHRRAVSVSFPGTHGRHRSAPRAADRAGAARREPADVRLRRHRPLRRAVHRRPRDLRALDVSRRRRRRRHGRDRSTRSSSRSATPATARSTASICDRFGDGLDVGWLRQPRYAGTMSGHFHVDGAGTSVATLALTGGGHLSRAELFKGTLSDAEVSIAIADGTLRASYDGRLAGDRSVDPVRRSAARRRRSPARGTVTATVRDLLTRTVTLADYDVARHARARPLAPARSAGRHRPHRRDAAGFDADRRAARRARPGHRRPRQRHDRVHGRGRRPTSATT